MLFMKGTPEEPRCGKSTIVTLSLHLSIMTTGFSRTMVATLNELGTEYCTFDILADDEVRQGGITYIYIHVHI